MRILAIVFFVTLDCMAQVVPENLEHEFFPKKFDSIARIISYETFSVNDQKNVKSISFTQSEYSDGNLFSTYESYRNKDYEASVSTFYTQDSKRIYNDGSCNCDRTVDTTYFRKENTKKGRIDTLLMKKGLYKVTKVKKSGENTEKFIYNKRHQLQTYYFGNSYTNFKYKKRYIEYSHHRADTIDQGYEQREKEGYVDLGYVFVAVDPSFYKLIEYNKLHQIVKTYTLDNFFEEELVVKVSEFSYNKEGLPLKESIVIYEFGIDNENAKNNLDILLKNIKEIDQLKKNCRHKRINETSYLYDNNKLITISSKEESYYNRNGVFEKEISEDNDIGIGHLEIVEIDDKRVINYFINNQLSEVQEFTYDDYDNIIEIQKYNYDNGKKELYLDIKREIIYNRSIVQKK
ncbi:hypothetical protein [Aquimarina sp. 2201CG14-23]|uniref:hypothetical protein n=1 Tax=Aquimarina mycalae TaxID=3040073 RepID=UPI002477F865|nr:hypothetical protein [Aquimarina sp. 2201CG14-23]MDH7447925.1 hypothetical protein [Aquimarina sp. 2201CG14-23]